MRRILFLRRILFWGTAILIGMIVAGGMPVWGQEPKPLVETEEGLYIDNSNLAIEWEPFVPASIFSICNPEGKCAEIDFSGDEIVYSGELEVAESAKIFFKYYGGLCPERSSDETKKE
ncbi:hypothetical protein LCGC14_1020530 [marine sediment metagenome]|uniref:Uncharacterized protein n=1 Tax=marine sediment metagenome TaxID=412755 RepID=A0A0F9R3G7_9ZZZZ